MEPYEQFLVECESRIEQNLTDYRQRKQYVRALRLKIKSIPSPHRDGSEHARLSVLFTAAYRAMAAWDDFELDHFDHWVATNREQLLHS